MSCPSISVCYASGSNSSQAGDVLVTTDSGATWNDTTLPPGTSGITSIACPSNSTCFAGDDRGVLLTSNFGATWRQEKINSAAVGVTDIACPSTSTCYALPSGESVAVYITTDSGEMWRDSPVRAAAGEAQIWPLGSISCPSVTTCFAENNQQNFVTTTDSGAVWENEDQVFAELDDGQDFALSCPSVSMCVTVGASGLLVTTDSGSTWTPNSAFGSYSGVDCPSSMVCFATASTGSSDADGGGMVVSTTDGGATWRERTYTPWYGGLGAISCPSTNTCYAGDNNTISDGNLPGFVIATTDSGRIWSTEALPPSIGALTDIACPSTTDCYALEDDVDPTAVLGQADFFATNDGGATWKSHTLSLGYNQPDSMACPSRLTCYVISTVIGTNEVGQSEILTTLDGGERWQVYKIGPPVENLGPIACPSTNICYAVGDGVVVTTDSGKTWEKQQTPAIQNLWLTAIACPSTTVCYATGFGDIVATFDSGKIWRIENAPTGSDRPSGIACASTTSCVIVGNVLNCLLGENDPCPPQRYATLSTIDSGRHWIGHSLPSDVNPIGVTCVNVSACYSTTYIGQPTNYDNGGPGGILSTSNLGETWSAETAPTETGAISAVTCPSQTICYAVGQGTGNIGGLILKAIDQ